MELVRLHGRENVMLVTADNRIRQIMQRAMTMPDNVIRKLGLHQAAKRIHRRPARRPVLGGDRRNQVLVEVLASPGQRPEEGEVKSLLGQNVLARGNQMGDTSDEDDGADILVDDAPSKLDGLAGYLMDFAGAVGWECCEAGRGDRPGDGRAPGRTGGLRVPPRW